ncbi:MAG: hypothetical protein R3F59_06005 [Myxococcota bacterium]
MRPFLPVVLLALGACSGADLPVDSDGDGLFDADEIALGSDPQSWDTDGDGLGDQREVNLGLDPTSPDTDDDKYTDRDELFEGTDPLDPDSRIYTGGWPYYFDKGSLLGGSTSQTYEEGKRFGRFKFVDQYGEEVNLFDFYNADKPVVIDVSALWCDPCNKLADWIGDEGDPLGFNSIWPTGAETVRKSKVYWVSIIGEGASRGVVATPDDAVAWSDRHPVKKIPVLADPDYMAVDYVRLSAWPTLILLEPDLKVSERHSPNCESWEGSYVHVLCELNEQFGE